MRRTSKRRRTVAGLAVPGASGSRTHGHAPVTSATRGLGGSWSSAGLLRRMRGAPPVEKRRRTVPRPPSHQAAMDAVRRVEEAAVAGGRCLADAAGPHRLYAAAGKQLDATGESRAACRARARHHHRNEMLYASPG